MARPVGWYARLAAALLLAVFGGAGVAAAHLGGGAYILVSQDFILPGQQFELIAADMGPDATVALEIVHEPVVHRLGNAQAAADGHFTATLSLAADFPSGYAQLFATATDGTTTSTWVLVGQRTAATPPPPSTGRGAWWTDPSVLVLLVFVIGAVAVVGYLLLRPNPNPIARAASERPRGRMTPRKRRSGAPRARR